MKLILSALLASAALYGQANQALLAAYSQASGPTITFDHFAVGGYVVSGTLSWSHTVGTGTNAAVLVPCWNQGTISSATFNGVAMTAIGSQAVTAPYASTLVFYVAYGPPTGTASTVSITSTSQLICFSESLFGVKQSGQPNTTSYISAGVTISCGCSAIAYAPATISPTNSGTWIVSLFEAPQSPPITLTTQPSPSAGGTYRGQDGFGINFFWDSGTADPSSGSYTLNAGGNGTGSTFQVFSIALDHA